jgi:hypothetical protein
MSIELNQCLHGYQNGHQLLNSSVELTLEEKDVLLFQSDLSGSNIDEGFDSYISGYPIDGSRWYAYSKTWYAGEMRRPGCVWTHTLLINFADVGKIPDFRSLRELFKRPEVDNYIEYGSKFLIEEDELLGDNYVSEGDLQKNIMLDAIYNNPLKTIIALSKSSELYEDNILEIWSDQWPRLRRNFLFCTGSLNLKKSTKKDFDFQVVPIKNLSTIERQSENLFIINTEYKPNDNWFILLDKYPKNSLRKFLWTYGSDIDGERKNYIPLIKIFNEIQLEVISFDAIGSYFKEFFNSPNEAKFLKSKLFGKESGEQFNTKESEILQFLLTSEDVSFLNLQELDIEERLLTILNNKGISLFDFLDVLENAKPSRVLDTIWSKTDFNIDELLSILEKKPKLVKPIISRLPNIALNINTWQTSDSLQYNILHSLGDVEIKNWTPYIETILKSGSRIIYEVKKVLGEQAVMISLDWLNKPSNSELILKDWGKYILLDNKYIFQTWLTGNEAKLNSNFLNILFSVLGFNDIQQLNIPITIWLKLYNDFKTVGNKEQSIYISCALLSVGLRNKIKGSEWLVADTFHDVYSFASANKIEPNIWSNIPKDIDADTADDNDDMPLLFQLIVGSSRKRKIERPSQKEYDEILIRTLVNKHIKYNWKSQAFINALKKEEEFRKVSDYCQQFSKGTNFLMDIIQGIKQKKIVLSTSFKLK